MFSKIINVLVTIITNKYLLVICLFAVWVLFFDDNSTLHQHKLQAELDDLTTKRDYYLQKLQDIKTDENQIMSNKATLERFARENYLMKRKDEDLYIVKSFGSVE
jgi:cell division protein FtsB